MAIENNNTSPAQNKLGELYVDFSTKGLGSLQKGLGGLAIGFKVAEKAAGALVTKLPQIISQTGSSALSLRRLSNSLGLSEEKLRATQTYGEKKGINIDAFFGAIAKTMDIRQKATREGLPGGWFTAINQYGLKINPFEFTATPEGQTEFFNKIGREVIKKPISEQRDIAQLLGYDESVLDIWKQGDVNLKEMTRVTQKTIETNEEMGKQWKRFWDNIVQDTQKIVGEEIAPALINLTDLSSDLLEGKNKKEIYNKFVKNTRLGRAIGQGSYYGEELYKNVDNKIKFLKDEKFKIIDNPQILEMNNKSSASTVPTSLPTGFATNITNDVKIDIKSTDPVLAAEEAKNKISQIDYNSLEYYNNTGH